MSIRHLRTLLNKRRKLTVLFAFLLAFAFNANLAHSHDGDSHDYYDCEICLKLDQSDELGPTETLKSEFSPTGQSCSDLALTPHFVDIFDVRSRSPPRT